MGNPYSKVVKKMVLPRLRLYRVFQTLGGVAVLSLARYAGVVLGCRPVF